MPQIKRKISLPQSLGAVAPFSILRDEEDNLYFSDEFHHRVISLNREGQMRWHIGGKGDGKGQFAYPRGMALGETKAAGKQRCLAVCDAWNHRVQLFDLQGHHMDTWIDFDGQAFKEVSDIRYADHPGSVEKNGCWLILDRGNHRLCVKTENGQNEGSLGRELPLPLESRWLCKIYDLSLTQAVKGLDPITPRYDPAYFPTRFLGYEEGPGFLVESLSDRVKQAAGGMLWPLSIVLPDAMTWISYAGGLFLAWDRNNQKIFWFDTSGEMIAFTKVNGFPVSSNADPDEIWLYRNGCFELWSFESLIGKEVARRNTDNLTALIQTAQAEMRTLEESAAFKPLLEGLVECLKIWDESLNLIASGPEDTAGMESARLRAVEYWQGIMRRCRVSGADIRKAQLLSIKLPWLIGQSDSVVIKALAETYGSFLAEISKTLTSCMRHRDDALFLWRELWMRKSEENDERIREITELLSFQLEMIRHVLGYWGSAIRRMELLAIADKSVTSEHYSLPHRHRRSAYRAYLRELVRYEVVSAEMKEQCGLINVIQTVEGHYYISVFERGTLIHLDAKGNPVEEIFGDQSVLGRLEGPAGLAYDHRGRIWISEQLGKRVQIYDPQKKGSEQSAILVDTGNLLQWPAGICEGENGDMIVADLAAQCLYKVKEDSPAEIFCGSSGSGDGELQFPTGVMKSNVKDDPGYWVVDQRNHRLQKLDPCARYEREFGQCGWGPGEMITPWFAAQFEDGLIAVSQCEVDWGIKLFTHEGKELDYVLLDYMPGGVFISERTLIVTEYRGNGIRVYERR